MDKDNILDFDDEAIQWVAYIFPQQEQIQAIAMLLDKYDIPHKIDPLLHKQRDIVPINPHLNLYHSQFQIKIPNNRTQQVDQLMNDNPELLSDEDAVRKLFLANSLDEQGWIDILLFSEEWMDRDVRIATELLASKGITIDPTSYNERRKQRHKERQQQKDVNQKREWLKNIGIALLLLAGLAWVLFIGGL